MQKNVSGQKWIVFAFDRTDNTPKTGDAAQITANLRIDGGAANAVDDTNPTELEDGYYAFDLTQAETNGDLIVICPASSTSNIQVIGVPGAVWTVPANFPALQIESDGMVHSDLKEWLAAAPGNTPDAALAAVHLDHLVTITGSVDDTDPGKGSFITDLSSSTDSWYNSLILLFTSGSLAGLARRIDDYVGSTRKVYLENDLPDEPADGDSFVVIGIKVPREPQRVTTL